MSLLAVAFLRDLYHFDKELSCVYTSAEKSIGFKLIMLAQVSLYSQTEIIEIILIRKLTF